MLNGENVNRKCPMNNTAMTNIAIKKRYCQWLQKKAIFPDSQSFVNLKSNTMKNTVQIYEFLRWVQILRKKKSLL